MSPITFLHPHFFLLAAAAPHGDQALTVFLVQIVLLIICGRLFGELMQRIGQPAVLGQLLAGIVLGPSVFGAIWPNAQHLIFSTAASGRQMLTAVSELGVLLLLLLTGMETNLALVKRVQRTAAFTSAAGIVIPFACGYLLGEYLPDSIMPDPQRRLITSLFLATALSISSVKIVAAVLREVDFLQRNLGQVILASAILDDTIGWIILALIGGLAAHGKIVVGSLLFSICGTGIFLLLSLTIGRQWVARIIRWVNDTFIIEMPVISAILVIMIFMALTTSFIGVHTVLGAFVAGILVGQSPILTEHIEEQLKGLIVAFFMPIFFGVAGLSIDLKVLGDPGLLELALLLIGIASLGKLGGCYLGSRLSGLVHMESLAVGLGMNARGSTEVILATIGLSMGVLNQQLFTIIVLMAVVTTLCMPPLLRWALARVPIGEEEKLRLETEAAEEKDLLPKIERLLVGFNSDEKNHFAARLAGWLIGTREITTTVIALESKNAEESKTETHAASHILIDAAHGAIESIKKQEKARTAKRTDKANPVDVVTSTDVLPAKELVSILKSKGQNGDTKNNIAETILTEAKNGYGMIFFGMGPTSIHSDFWSAIDKVLRAFSGSLAILFEPKNFKDDEKANLKKILVPAIGTDYSRFGAEVAVAIAKGCGASVTALHIAASPDMNLLRNPAQLLRTGRALVKDIVALGKRENVKVHPKALMGRGEASAILRQAKKEGHQLIVIGTKSRVGDELNFGNIAMAMLEKAPCPVLIVNS